MKSFVAKSISKVDFTTEKYEFSKISKAIGVLQPGFSIVDIGSGLAEFADFFSKEYPKSKITCVDINEDLVKLAESKGYKSKVADITTLPFESNSFDVLHCSHVVEHLSYPNITLALDEMLRVTKKGGLIIIRTPLVINHRFYNDIDHVRPYPPDAILNYFNYEKQQKKSEYSVEEVGRWYTRIYFEIDPLHFPGVVVRRLNLIMKLMWLFFRIPWARPNNYGIVLKKQ